MEGGVEDPSRASQRKAYKDKRGTHRLRQVEGKQARSRPRAERAGGEGRGWGTLILV